jgi:hypothetical protein
MEIAEVLQAELNILKDELIAEYDALGMRASGQWADSLEVQTSEMRGTLLGLDYTRQLQFGRDAGRFPPINLIEKWIEDKGINYTGITLSSLAFLIARKISREGWDRNGFGGVDLIGRIVKPERIQRIIDKVGEVYLSGFVNEVITQLKVA